MVHGSIFREKQTAAHIAFQNIAHCSIFREQQTAVHIAFQNIVHGSIFREKQTPVHIVFQSIVYCYRAYRHGVVTTLLEGLTSSMKT